jgi:hypothetical protein
VARLRRPSAAHQADVDPGNRQDAGAAPGGGGHGRVGAVLGAEQAGGVAGQERDQVLAHAHRPDARAAAAVRNAEGLVQVQVADVGVVGDARPADQGVHVGPVQVDLAAGLRTLLQMVTTSSSNTPWVDG